MCKTPLTILVATALLVAIAATGFAVAEETDDEEITFEGVALDADGDPINQTDVHLVEYVDNETTVLDTTTPDVDGAFGADSALSTTTNTTFAFELDDGNETLAAFPDSTMLEHATEGTNTGDIVFGDAEDGDMNATFTTADGTVHEWSESTHDSGTGSDETEDADSGSGSDEPHPTDLIGVVDESEPIPEAINESVDRDDGGFFDFLPSFDFDFGEFIDQLFGNGDDEEHAA